MAPIDNGSAATRGPSAFTRSKSAPAIGFAVACLLPAVALGAKPMEEARVYLESASELVSGPGRLPVIDAAAVLPVVNSGQADALRYDISLAAPDNSEASLARLIALWETPYFDELEARAWLVALQEGTSGLALGWTGADPIVLARALELAAHRPGEVSYVDEDENVHSIYALLHPRLMGALSSTRRADGGFGFADEPSDIAATAEVTLALSRYPSDWMATAIVSGARAWLTARAADVAALSAADLAFLLLAADLPEEAVDGLLVALEARQLPDGSFDGEVRATALAMRAMTQHLPNVSVEVPASAQTQVGQGQPLAVSVRVTNTSSRVVPASELAFRLLDASGAVAASGVVPVPAMLGRESRTVLVQTTGPGTTGTYALELVGNAGAAFDEASYDDNLVRLRIQVTARADLVLEPIDLTTIPSPPLLHETTRVTVRVRNLGETPARNVHVQLFAGDPDSGGKLIGETVLNVVAKGIPRSLDVSHTFRSVDPVRLHARLDPADSVLETDETNNVASVTLTPKSPAEFQVDFIAKSMAPVSGSRIAQGDPVSVKATFHLSLTRFGQDYVYVGVRDSWPFTTVPIALFRESPEGALTLVDQQEANLLNADFGNPGVLGFYYSYALPSDLPPGTYRYRFVVDPAGTRGDVTPADGSISTVFEITNGGVAELLFEPGSVRADLPIVDAAHPTVVRARIRNIGLVTATDVPVKFAAPNRAFTVTVPLVAPGETRELAETVTFADVSPGHDVVLTIDPGTTIPESTRANNTETAALRAGSRAIEIESVTPSPDPSPGGGAATLRIVARNVGYAALDTFTAAASIRGLEVGRAIFRTPIPVGEPIALDLPVSLAQLMTGDETANLLLSSSGALQDAPAASTEVPLRIRRPDFAVATRGIALTQAVGSNGEPLLVPSITVDNLGGIGASASLRIYRGYPSAGGLVETARVAVEAGGGFVFQGAPFPAPAEPPFVVTVVLDEEDSVPELDEANNVGTRPVEKNLGDVVVAFDETHGPGSTVGLAPGGNGSRTGDHADWVRDLEAHGYVVTTLNPDTDGFSPAKLRGVDVLVGPTSVVPLAQHELALLKEFVERGGGYFLMGEWGDADDKQWWGWEVGVASLFGLVPMREVVMKGTQCTRECQVFMRSEGNVRSHPVTSGVERILGTWTGGFGTVPEGTAVLMRSGPDWKVPDVSVIGVFESGSGRVGFTGDGTMADTSIASCNVMAGCGIQSPYYTHDNRRLLRQMIDWLANGGPGDFPADLAISPSAVTLSNADPVAGEVVRVSATVRNVGGAATSLGPTVVRFFDGSRADGVVLAEVPVPDLTVDQAFEAFFDWDTARAWGPHTITAVVDPDGTIAERREENNEALAPIRVRARHDLRIDPSDLRILPGTPPLVSLRVHNVGHAETPPGLSLRWMLSEWGQERKLDEGWIPSVPARGAVDLTLEWPGEFPSGAFELEAVVDADGALLDAHPEDNRAFIVQAPPEVSLRAPEPEMVWGGVKTIRWEARSALRPRFVSSISMAPAGGQFTGLGEGVDSFQLDTTRFPDGAYRLRVTVNDALQETSREVPFTIRNAGLAVRTFGAADSWTGVDPTGTTAIRLPVGSRVTSATVLLDSVGSTGVRIGDGMAANLGSARITRFRGRLHFIAEQGDVLRDWVSDDDGATWKAPMDLSLPGVRVRSASTASNGRALHVAYLTNESPSRLLLRSSLDGQSWSSAAVWGQLSGNLDVTLTATEDGLAAVGAYLPGDLYVATADASGASLQPLTHVTVGLAAGPLMAVRSGDALRIAFTDAVNAIEPQNLLAYMEVPVDRYADSDAYSAPVRLDGTPTAVSLLVVGDRLELSYTRGNLHLYQRCTLGAECIERDRWLPEPAATSWSESIATLQMDHGASGATTSSVWLYGGRWYAAQSVRFGDQWGEWFDTGVTAGLGTSNSILHEPGSICGAGNVGGKFHFVCVPTRAPLTQEVDVGGDGTVELSRSRATTPAVTSALAASLNSWLASHVDGDDGRADGMVEVPIAVATRGAGQTVLRNLEVRYVPSGQVAAYALPEVFSPGSSPGSQDAALLSLTSPEPIAILSASGAVARTLALTPSGSRFAVSFDGRGGTGESLASGRYRFGPLGSPVGEVEIDDIAPTVAMDAIQGPIGSRVAIRGRATDADWAGATRNFARYLLEWSADGVAWSTAATGTSPVAGVLGELNAAGISTGSVHLRLTAWDVAGNSATAARTASLDPAAPPPPLITSPAVAGTPVDSIVPTVTVAGTGEVGTEVRVYASGSIVGQVPCDGRWTLTGVALTPGITTLTASAVRNGVEGSQAAPVEVGLYALSVTVDPIAGVGRHGETTATVSVLRTSAVRGPLNIRISALDALGAPSAVRVSPSEVVVDPGSGNAVSFSVVIAPAGASAGTYRLRAEVVAGALLPAAGSAAFEVTAAQLLTARIVSDRAAYEPSDTVELAASVESDLASGAAFGLTAYVTITDPTGTVVDLPGLWVGDLLPGQRWGSSVLPASGPFLAGRYLTSLLILDAFGSVLASAIDSFEVVPATPGSQLEGSITVTPSEYRRGQPVQASFSIRNGGRAEQVAAWVQLVDASSGLVVARSDGARALEGGETWLGSVELSTPADGSDLLAVLVGNGRALAATIVPVAIWTDTAPPSIVVAGVVEGEYRSGAVLPLVTVTDESPFTSSMTLDGETYSDGTAVLVEGGHLLTVEARDTWGNASSASIAFTIDVTPPEITVTGVSDGGPNVPPVTPSFSATDLHLAGAAAGMLDGAPFEPGISLSTPGEHLLIVTAFDLAGNVTETTVRFTVAEGGADAEVGAQEDDGPRVLVGLACRGSSGGEPDGDDDADHDEDDGGEGSCDGDREDRDGRSDGDRDEGDEGDRSGGGDDADRDDDDHHHESGPSRSCDDPSAPFLFSSLRAAAIPFEATSGGDAFLARFRTHWHDVRVLYGYDPAESPSLAELREATWSGGGLVVVLAGHPDSDPTLGDALGLRLNGIVGLERATVMADGPLGAARPLPLHGAAPRQSLEGAQPSVQTGEGVVVSTHFYGRGRVVTISFDPEQNANPEVAELLVRAIRWAGAAEAASLVAGVPYFLSLGAAPSPGVSGDYRLTATPPPGADLLAAPLAATLDPPTWFFWLDGVAGTQRSLVLRTPDTELAPLALRLSAFVGGAWLDLTSNPVEIPAGPDVVRLRAAALAAIEELSVGREDRGRKEAALVALRSLPQGAAPSQDVARAIQKTLDAVDRLRAIRTTNADVARAATDALLRALELHSQNER